MKPEILRLYALLASTILFIDRFTKHIVMDHISRYKINDYMAIELMYNRGISFGLFHSQDIITFAAVNILIGSCIAWIAAHMYSRIVQHKIVVGEVFIVTGAMSNFIDRFVHEGVVDFVLISYKNYYFPVFNCADTFIFLGFCLIFIVEYFEPCKK